MEEIMRTRRAARPGVQRLAARVEARSHCKSRSELGQALHDGQRL